MSEESQRPLNAPSPEFRKSVFHSFAHLTAAQNPHNISKNFQYSSGTLYKVHTEALPRVQNARECTANSAVNPVKDPAMDSWGASSVSLRRLPSVRLPLNLQRPTKITPQSNYRPECNVDANIQFLGNTITGFVRRRVFLLQCDIYAIMRTQKYKGF